MFLLLLLELLLLTAKLLQRGNIAQAGLLQRLTGTYLLPANLCLLTAKLCLLSAYLRLLGTNLSCQASYTGE